MDIHKQIFGFSQTCHKTDLGVVLLIKIPTKSVFKMKSQISSVITSLLLKTKDYQRGRILWKIENDICTGCFHLLYV